MLSSFYFFNTEQMKITRLLPVLLLLVATKAWALDYPAATRDSILRHITGASMPTRVIDLARLGAKTDGKTDARPAMIKALRQAHKCVPRHPRGGHVAFLP